MSGIFKRTAFIDSASGYVKMHDYKIVTTAIGTMVEPGFAFDRSLFGTGVLSFEPTDDISRVDEIKELPIGQEQRVFAFGGDTPLHGGILAPRTGY